MNRPNHPSASLFCRIAAALYDALLIGGIFAVLTFIIVIMRGHAVPPGNPAFRLALAAAAIFYFTGFWVKGGQTPGMKTWHVKLESVDGTPVSWRSAALRFAAGCVSIAVLGLGFLWALVDADRQAWHDRIAATRLVRTPLSGPA